VGNACPLDATDCDFRASLDLCLNQRDACGVRIAIVADVHGSIKALEAVTKDVNRRKPDLVLHGGDLAVNGPRPGEVIDLIRDLGWPGVVGNTDEMLWRPEGLDEQAAIAPRLTNLLRVLFLHTAPATAEMLGDERIGWLKELPSIWRDSGQVLIHASPGDLWRAPMPSDDDENFVDAYGNLEADLVAYGHIHRPFVRKLSAFTVANCGSAGLSYDGDSRASYLLIDEGRPEVVRVEYDVEGEVKDLLASGYPFGSWLAEIRRTGRFSPPPDA
jgi:predicted phosphodiesterase